MGDIGGAGMLGSNSFGLEDMVTEDSESSKPETRLNEREDNELM